MKTVTNIAKNEVTIQDVRNVNNKLKTQFSSIGGCISLILTLDKKETEKQETKIIDFLVRCKKDAKIYKELCEVVKPNYKSGNYNKYSVLLGAKKLINK